MDKAEVSPGWVCATVGDAVTNDGIFTDGDWVETKDQDPNGDVRLIQLADVGDGVFLDKSSRLLTKGKAYELNCTFLTKGDLLVARMPDPLGRCCIFPLGGVESYVTVVDVCAVRFGTSSIVPKYMMYAINSPRTRTAIEALKSGSTRKRISRGNLARVEIPLAPENEQHRIVAKIEELFSELDKGVESLKTARAKLNMYRQTVLKHAFEGKLTAQWREENKDKLETPEQLLARIKQERAARYEQQLKEWGVVGKKGIKPKAPKPLPPLTSEELAELPELPEGWSWTRFGLLDTELRRGPFGSSITKSMFVPSGFKVYEQGNAIYRDASRGNYFVNHEKYEELSGFTVLPGDFIVSCAGTVGRIFELPEDAVTGVINQALMRVRINDTILNRHFFAKLFESAFFQRKVLSDAKGTAMVNLAGIKELNLVPVAICGLSEQKEIDELLDERLSEVDQCERIIATSLQQADALRRSILKKAFSGQLITQDPNDEPASALLDRIRAEKERATRNNPSKKTKKKKPIT